MSRAVLGIGSNLDDPIAQLRRAVDAFSPVLQAVSPVYESEPWGGVPQDSFLNAVLIVDDPAVDAAGWLATALRVEQDAGRVREVRWGPRTLDVDVISVDDVVSDDPRLMLPHPRAQLRSFVLVPWLDIDPDAVLLGHGRVADLVAGLDCSDIRRRDDLALVLCR